MLKRSQALKQLIIFSLPIIFGHIGLMLIGTGDMLVAGRYSREALAAIGLAISVANPIMISLLGLLFCVSPLLAQKKGRGEDIKEYFWTVIFASLIITLFSTGLTLLSTKLIPIFDYGKDLNRLIIEYLQITSFSTIGLYVYQGVKEFFQSEEKTTAANLIAIIGVGVNLVFNYVFVFGKLGMPQLHEAGLAWASLGVRIFMALSLFALTYKLWKTPFRIDKIFLKEMLRLGAPVSATLFFEILAFCSVTLFVGKFAEVQTAANNIALNLASLAFMVPLSISSAVAVKIGHAYGEKNYLNMRLFGEVGLLTSFAYALCIGFLFYFASTPIISFYTDDSIVLEWGKKILFWVACFQLFDGAQVVLSGILRGISITKPSSVAVFIGYWIIGIPIGYYLAFHTTLQAQGLWIGLALALSIVSVMLGIVLKTNMRRIVSNG